MRGKLRLISLDGIVGASQYKNVDVRPEPGYEWRVIELWGFNDEGLKGCVWQYKAENEGIVQKATNTPAANIRVSITDNITGEGNTLASPLTLRHELYARWTNTDAMTAGKILKVRGVVEEYWVGIQ